MVMAPVHHGHGHLLTMVVAPIPHGPLPVLVMAPTDHDHIPNSSWSWPLLIMVMAPY